jgi:L-alanine-DL-glutamate epimerase-like enolase superfamily enzyme
MRITDIQTLLVLKNPKGALRIALPGDTMSPSVIVRVGTDEGICGFGEASPFAPVTGCDVPDTLDFIASIAPALIGTDAFGIERSHAIMDGVASGHTPGKAAIDIALYDILGKRAGLPLYRLLGGSEPMVHSDMTIGIDNPEVMAAKARHHVDAGFAILKIKVGIDPAADLEAIRLIRETVGPTVKLRLDANQSWSREQTIRTMHKMERYGVDEIEQPLPADDLEGLRFVREHITQDLMLDESVHTPSDALRAANAAAADIINIKLMKSGGLYHALRVNAVAQAAGLPCMVGCMSETRVGIAAGAALAASQGNIRYADLDSHRGFDEIDGISDGFEQDGGLMRLAEQPGLGVEVRFDFSRG